MYFSEFFENDSNFLLTARYDDAEFELLILKIVVNCALSQLHGGAPVEATGGDGLKLIDMVEKVNGLDARTASTRHVEIIVHHLSSTVILHICGA